MHPITAITDDRKTETGLREIRKPVV